MGDEYEQADKVEEILEDPRGLDVNVNVKPEIHLILLLNH